MMSPRRWIVFCLMAVLWLAAGGCGEETPPAASSGDRSPTAGTPDPRDTSDAQSETENRPLVIFLGDSLTAGLGLPGDEAYPAVLQRQLAEAGTPVRIVNAGVSGDTTAGGLSRVDWLLKQKPDVVVVALGSNDAMRGQPIEAIGDNLRQITRRVQAAEARVVLLGMSVPTNYGPDYVRRFDALYDQLAQETGVTYVPRVLEGVGGVREMNQADGIHPTAEGQATMARNILPTLQEVLAETE